MVVSDPWASCMADAFLMFVLMKFYQYMSIVRTRCYMCDIEMLWHDSFLFICDVKLRVSV